MAMNIVKNEGMAGLYAGVTPAVARHIPYTGFRASVVYFNVPTDRCDTADLARLKHLGFRVPSASPFAVPLPWP